MSFVLFIFPRVKFKPFMINGGPAGCIGTANGSGWMQGEDFVVFLKHFVHHTRPTPENKVIRLLFLCLLCIDVDVLM